MPKKLPYTFEPWRAWRDTTWDLGFRFGPPHTDDDEVVARWHAARDRAERDAKVVLFGSGLREPCVSYALEGRATAVDGSGIVATVTPVHSDHPQAADHVQVADRVVACVNACAGIADPVGTLAIARTLLWELHRGLVAADHPSVLALLDRLHPTDAYRSAMERLDKTEES